MREIKFRAWIAEGKIMTEGVQPNFSKSTPCCMVPDRMMQIIEPGGEKHFWYDVPVDAIMQFTGLKDKNGKEIYEGDIIERSIMVFGEADIEEWVIYWGTWCYMRRPLDNENGFAFDVIDARTNCKVIGNIYETAELLNPNP